MSDHNGDSGDIRINERTLLWGLVVLLTILVTVEGLALLRHGDRLDDLDEKLEQRSAAGRRGGVGGGWQSRVNQGGETAAVGKGGGVKQGRGKAGKRGEGGGMANPGAGALAEYDAEKTKERKAETLSKIDTYIADHGVDAETAESLKTTVSDSMDTVNELRRKAAEDEITASERHDGIQEELKARREKVIELLGEDGQRVFQNEVFGRRGMRQGGRADQARGGAGSAGEEAGAQE